MKYWAITVAFMLIAVSLSGTPADREVNQICLLFLPSETEEANELRAIVIEELTREIEKRGFTIIPEQNWRAKLSQEGLSSLELMQGSAAVRLAERLEADIALLGTIRIENQVIIIRIQGYEVTTGALIFSREEREAKNIGIYNTVSSLSKELIDALLGWAESQSDNTAHSRSETSVLESKPDGQRSRELTPPLPERVLESEAPPSEEPKQDDGELVEREMKVEPVVLEQPPDREDAKVLITLLSTDEGAQVYLEPDHWLGTIEDGKLVIEVPANAQLAIETTKPGYHINREYFDVDDQPAVIRLRPLFKRTRFGFELFLTSSQLIGIGAGFRFYVVPDYIMFKIDDYIYLSICPGCDDSPPAFHNDFRIQFGSYLFSPPSRRLRFGVATGAGIILSALGKSATQPKNSAFYDFYWDVVDLWIDFNWHKGAVFFRVETKYALGLGACLLEPGFLAEYGPQYTVGWLMKF